MKKALIMLILFFSLNTNIKALNIHSEHAVMYNLNDNTIVYEKNKDEITTIASLTKIMTTLVAIEQISNINETVVLNDSMFVGLYEAEAAVIGLVDGQVLTYEDLLYGTFISSAADATRALTISLAGSEDNFVKLMNKKAKELGLINTNFTNATGLDYGNQTSTVNEVAVLLKSSLKNELFKKIFESKSYTLSDGSKTIYSTLLSISLRHNLDVNNILGSKTGYTDDAGFCLASVSHDKINDIKYLLVTTKAPVSFDNAYHLEDSIKIYDYYFTNYKYHNLIDKDREIISLKTKYSKTKKLNIKIKEDIKMYFDKTFDQSKVAVNYNGVEVVRPKFKKGQQLGVIDIMYNNEKVKTIDILLEEKIPFSIKEYIFKNGLFLSSNIILWTFIIVKLRKRI